jgi:ribose transport system permease protein
VTTTSLQAPPSGRPDGLLRARPDGWGTAVTVALAWLILIAASSLHSSDFFSHQTVLAVTFTMAITGVLAVGESLVALSGGILDLSLPTALVLPAYLTTVLLDHHVPTAAVVLLALLVGALWGALNATIIVFGKLNPIIVTLATNFAGLAALFLIFQAAQTPQASGIRQFGKGYFLGLPNIWWPMVVLIVVVGLLIPRTRYGRRMTAVGGNAGAAKARGISLPRTRYAVFIASGVCGGLAGLIFAASNASFTPNEGAAFLLPVLAAVILAGISLQGGRGNLLLLLLSVGFLSTVPTSLVFFGLNSDWQIVFQGLILIIAVSIDGHRQRSARA